MLLQTQKSPHILWLWEIPGKIVKELDPKTESDRVNHDTELAKKMIKDLKGTKIKVQAQIMDDQIRVSGKSRDDLQGVIAFFREQDYDIDLQFTNYR